MQKQQGYRLVVLDEQERKHICGIILGSLDLAGFKQFYDYEGGVEVWARQSQTSLSPPLMAWQTGRCHNRPIARLSA